MLEQVEMVFFELDEESGFLRARWEWSDENGNNNSFELFKNLREFETFFELNGSFVLPFKEEEHDEDCWSEFFKLPSGLFLELVEATGCKPNLWLMSEDELEEED